jgi:hypothetical protein
VLLSPERVVIVSPCFGVVMVSLWLKFSRLDQAIAEAFYDDIFTDEINPQR